MEPVSRVVPFVIVYRTRAFNFRAARITRASVADLARFTQQNFGRDMTAEADIETVRAAVARWCEQWCEANP